MSGLRNESDEVIEPTLRPLKLEFPDYGIFMAESHHHRGFLMQPTQHAYTEIYYILDGVADCIIDGVSVQLEPGQIFIIPKDAAHFLRDRENSPLSLYILAFKQSSVDGVLTFREQIDQLNALARMHRRALLPHDYNAYEIPRMLRKIIYEQRVQASGYIPTIQATLLNAVVAINRAYQSIPVALETEISKPTAERIHEVANFVAANFFESISVEDMARMACLSVRQFTNQFKAIHGVTLMQFLHYHRVRYAKKLLAETDQQIISICFESGFNDLAHFYRIFKRLTDVSPRKFRINALARAYSYSDKANDSSQDF